MKTARQTLRSFFHWETDEEFNERDKNILEASAIYGAMEENAKQEAIEFARWVCDNLYVFNGNNWYRFYMDADVPDIFLTDEQLYKKFKDENNK